MRERGSHQGDQAPAVLREALGAAAARHAQVDRARAPFRPGRAAALAGGRRAPGIDEGRKVRQFAIEAARLMADRHCEDVLLLDVRGVSQVCDYLLIASGTSDRQMRSVADELADVGAEQDLRAFHTDADSASTWVVVDFIVLVVHLFEPGMR